MSIRDLPDIVKEDALFLLLGERLGAGVGRIVYAHALDPTLVVKLETARQSFQNAIEWDTWHKVKGTKIAKWFAPCLHISQSGMAMIQRRTTPLTPATAPKRIPNFFADTKYGNYGFINGQLVAHDYGISHLHIDGINNVKMVIAEWWGATNDR